MSPFQWLMCLLVIVWIYWLWTRRQFYAKILEIPGPLGYPLLGIGLDFVRREKILQTLQKFGARYGSLVLSWVGTYPALFVSEPEIVRDILTSPSCVNKSCLYKALSICGGDGLFTLKDPEWSVHRKHLNSAFSNKALLSFMPIFNEEGQELVKTFGAIGEANKPFDLINTLMGWTLNVTTATTLGKSVRKDSSKSQRNLLKSYHCIVETLADMVFAPWLTIGPFRKLYGFYKPYNEALTEIRQFIGTLIQERLGSEVKNLPSTGSKHIFIDHVIDLARSNIFTTKNMEDQTHHMVIGAFETTANSVALILILLAMFPEYQQQAFEELLSIFPERGNFEVTCDDIKDMSYMDRVINESMRVLPLVPLVGRENTQDVKLSNGVVVPAGTQIGIDIFNMHRRKDIWGPDADIFNPDNFLPHNMEDKHPYAFIPFTKGIRNCIGWRYAQIAVKVTLAKLLRNYRFSTDFQYKDLEYVECIILKLKHMPTLKIHKREL